MPVTPQKKHRREDWRARAQEMRSQFRDEFSNANRTQYYVGDADPSLSFESPGGSGKFGHLQNKLAQRGDMRNHQLWDLVQRNAGDAKLGGPGGPEPTLTGAMPDVPPEDPNAIPPAQEFEAGFHPLMGTSPKYTGPYASPGSYAPPMLYGSQLYNPGKMGRRRRPQGR